MSRKNELLKCSASPCSTRGVPTSESEGTGDTTTRTTSSSDNSPGGEPSVPKKRKTAGNSVKKEEVDVIDLAMLESIKDIQAMAKDSSVSQNDPDISFCMDLASRLKKMPAQKNAFAKMQLQSLMYSLEYGQSTLSPPPGPTMPTSSFASGYYEDMTYNH